MTIPFIKAQAVGNDFLIVEESSLTGVELSPEQYPELARRICDRHHGVGADGLEIVRVPGDRKRQADAEVRIFNADGSEAEISGNGTRCVAAYLVAEKGVGETLRIATKAGIKQLKLLERSGQSFSFEMEMGRPRYSKEEIGCGLDVGGRSYPVTLVNVGNPQCVLVVDDFDFDWRRLGREIEVHPRFPNRTNVSFAKVVDRHTIDVRFWERGAGETASSGTGSTGAAVATILSGQVETPVTVSTVAGNLHLRWDEEAYLIGPAEIVAKGEYFWSPESRAFSDSGPKA